MSTKKTQLEDKNIHFSPDAGLMYLIQQVTKQPSADIMGFFFDFGKEVLLEGISKMEGKSIRKDIRDYYPGTAIPFKLLVKAHRWSSDPVKSGTIEIDFPDNSMYIRTSEMLDMIIERELLGGSGIPDFEKPASKTPKMYRDLIAKVLKGEKADE